MKILDAGHTYELDILDNKNKEKMFLSFVKREGDYYPFNHGSHAGTNCQEVLRVLIDRTEYLQKQKPCFETEAILGNLKTALALFELRAANQHGRFLNLESLQHLMIDKPCIRCGHIGCCATCGDPK